MNTLLIGPRGCGKSTIGRRLAEQVGWPFVELDERVLEKFAESTVKAVWSARGQEAWRKAEDEALGAVLADDHQIVALGGGTPMITAAFCWRVRRCASMPLTGHTPGSARWRAGSSRRR